MSTYEDGYNILLRIGNSGRAWMGHFLRFRELLLVKPVINQSCIDRFQHVHELLLAESHLIWSGDNAIGR